MRQERQVSEFVVEIDRQAVEQARRWVLRGKRVSAWSFLIGAVMITGLTVSFRITRLTGDQDAAFMGFPGLMMLIAALAKFVEKRLLRKAWAANEIPAVAMRLSASGLRCSIDAAPDHVFLPWTAVTGFRLRTVVGQQVLVLELTPGVTPSTPGVAGLDHPDVQRALHRKLQRIRGLCWAVRTLRQPPENIDQVLAHLTYGRVRIQT